MIRERDSVPDLLPHRDLWRGNEKKKLLYRNILYTRVGDFMLLEGNE